MLGLLAAAWSAHALAAEPGEALRHQLFKDSTKAACVLVKTDPRGTIVMPGAGKAELDSLQHVVSDILKAIHDKSARSLQPYFHSRLNVTMAALDETFGKLNFTYGAPFEGSIYHLWALNTVDGSPTGQACPGDDVTVFPHYGYPLQFGLWLQVMGQKEVGRIYLSLVPQEGTWAIGAFRTEQWTHAGKDFAEWADAAAKAAQQGLAEAAYLKYDTAAKLTDGGSYLTLSVRAELLKARDAVMTLAQWEGRIKAALKAYDVAYVATILVPNGDGISLRLRTGQELALEAMEVQCRQVAQSLAKLSWGAVVTGVRCSFLLPSEDAKKDGAMGSLYTELHPAKH